MKLYSNMILLYKSSGTNMEEDQKVGIGWMCSCEIVRDTGCGLVSTQTKVCAWSFHFASPLSVFLLNS